MGVATLVVACSFVIMCNPSDADDNTIKCSASCVADTALRLLCPDGSRDYVVGDKVQVKWCYATNNTLTGVVIRLSVDDGRSWPDSLLLTGDGQILFDEGNTYTWTVRSNHTGTQCLIRVEGYNDPDLWDQSAQPFVVGE
jgi:hypothetical protein